MRLKPVVSGAFFINEAKGELMDDWEVEPLIFESCRVNSGPPPRVICEAFDGDGQPMTPRT